MIPDHIRANFQTLMRAAENGDLALMECADAESGAPRYVICAVGHNGGAAVLLLTLVAINHAAWSARHG